jgi:hypothetical protein
VADEQRAPNTVIIDPSPAPLAGDTLRAEIERLSSLLAAEQAAAAAAEAEQAPPPPWEESLIALFESILAALGNPTAAEHALKQLRRALQK